MEISIADEQAYHYVPQVSPEVAHDRVEQKKTQLVAGTMGALISRPKPEEIRLLGMENRLEPFWLITISTRTVYDRNRTYTVPVSGLDVQRITILGNDFVIEAKPKETPKFSLNAVEHCLDTAHATCMFNGITCEKADFSKYLTSAKTVIVDLESFAPPGVLVVPPQMHATAVVRQALSEIFKQVQQAYVIHEERVDIENLELNFRPVYAFEYDWTSKGKRSVIEFDALTGDANPGGTKLSDKFGGIVTRDLLFDVTADAIGLVVPGGSIAVKLVKAVVDKGNKK
jgi:hypothetical protein